MGLRKKKPDTNPIPKIGNRGKRHDPNKPTALYRHYDANGRLLYVGISLNHISRLVGHRSNAEWFKQISNMTVEWYETREKAEWAEIVAIKKENPFHNRERYRNIEVLEKDTEEVIRELPNDPRLLNLIVGIAQKVDGFEGRMDELKSDFFEVQETERGILKHMVEYENISSWFKEKTGIISDSDNQALNIKQFMDHFQFIHHFMDKIILGLELIGYRIDTDYTKGMNLKPYWDRHTQVFRGGQMKSLYGNLEDKIERMGRHLNAKICRLTGEDKDDYNVYIKSDPLPTGTDHFSRWKK